MFHDAKFAVRSKPPCDHLVIIFREAWLIFNIAALLAAHLSAKLMQRSGAYFWLAIRSRPCSHDCGSPFTSGLAFRRPCLEFKRADG